MEVAMSLPIELLKQRNDHGMCFSSDLSCSLNARDRKIVCVTSGNSYFGSHLIKKLLACGYLVRVTIQNQANLEDMKELMREEMEQLESVVVARMGDLESLCSAFRGCHAIFHTSSFIDPHGISGYTERTAFLETEAAKNVIEACGRAAYIKRCIFTSSLLACIWKGNDLPNLIDESFWSDETFCRENKDSGLIVEPMTTSSSSQPARSSAPQSSSSSSSSTSNNQPRQRNSGPASRTSGTSTTPTSSATSLRWNRQTLQFSVNAWVLVVAILAILPLIPANLSNRAFRLAFAGTACSSLYSLYSLYGKPSAWNLQAVQVWFQSVIVTKDFIYFIYCLTFVTSHLYLKFALIPVLCRALEHVAKFLRRNFSTSSLYRKYLEEACVWVGSNTTTLSILSSQAEIGLGFLLIVSLLSWQRNIIQAFMYWQLLKLMYQAPATAGYHQNMWAKIGRHVNPLIQRYAPFMHTPISAIQRWWFR